MGKLKSLSPQKALRKFGFKQSLRGALIVGILAGLMAGGQGAAYATTYPDDQSRDRLKSSLERAPALGILYGEISNLPTPAGYMVYRTVTFLGFVASIWGIMTVTRLLRGQEEDGRWEMIATGSTSSKGASLQIYVGFLISLLLAFAISAVSITLMGASPKVDAPSTAGLYISLAIFAPALLFSGLGFLVSQLSTTKRRALFYGLVPLLILFAVRAIGNTTDSMRWLKHFTPFGWTDLVSPVIDPNLAWLLPSLLLGGLFVGLGAFLITKRDLGTGIIPESSMTKPHYLLLGSATAFALRRNLITFVSWGVIALGVSALIAEISSIAADAASDSESIRSALSQLGGTNNIAVAFIGAGLIFSVIVLLIMATVGMSGVRSSEAKNQLDNILVQPVKRSHWLIGRLLVIIGAFTLISLMCTYATWAMAHAQHITLDLGTLLLIGIALTGTAVFTLGFGTLLYGIFPRFAVAGMYVVIGWSFLIDMIGSAVKLKDIFVNSSLFHYVSVSPVKTPDWQTFAWLVGIGLVMAIIGIVAFSKRDLVTE